MTQHAVRFFALGLMFISRLAFGAGPAASAITLHATQVSPHVYYFGGQAGMASQENKGFMSNAGFVVTGDGVVVFDALATPALGEAMVQAIKKVTQQPIKLVVVSHYHADHFYGLQALKAAGAQVWAHTKSQAYLNSDDAKERLAQRRADLAPWVNDQTRLVPADRWLTFSTGRSLPFKMGEINFRIIDVSGAHSDSDTMLYVENDGVLFAGDLFFTGRIPFVGDADSKAWLAAMDRMLQIKPSRVIPGHGAMSDDPATDMLLTKNYLLFLREKMGKAVADFMSFDEAYDSTDWSAYKNYPAFENANRPNAFGQFLRMEKESLGQ
jgi:glyoxylase-like metal-dependent hydrolase (beta-lactamase superfamily II)